MMGSLHHRRAKLRRALVSACSVAVLVACAPVAAWAQDSAQPAAQPSQQEAAPTSDGEDTRRIGVIGNRTIVASLEDVEPEQTYDEDRIDSYAVSTVGELLDEIHGENGDDDPSILVNGQPVSDLGDIADLPVEAIASIEALPRGSAQRVNGGAGQRAYNVVLRPQVRSLTATASREMATEGGWAQTKGEAIGTWISGQDRFNVTLRGSESGLLFESERDDFIPRTETTPYSPVGNVIPFTGTQVDPALSALAGQVVTVVALPAGNTQPTLAQLVPGANQTNPSTRSLYRTLRSANRPYELTASGNKTLAPWLSLSFNGRLNWTKTESYSGLPAARFQIANTNAFTPFTVPVYLALNDPARPLRGRGDNTTGAVSATFNATFGEWRASLLLRFDERERTYLSDFTSSSTLTVAQNTNPFGGTLAAQIPVTTRRSHSQNGTREATAEAEGPLFDLWAGPLRARIGAGATWDRLDSTDTINTLRFRRHEYAVRAGITIPLTNRALGVLPDLGDSEIAFDIGTADLGSFGTLDRHSIAFNWQPIQWLRLSASEDSEEHAVQPELAAAPQVVTPNVPYFDPLTGQTVDVTTIYGGAGALVNDRLRTRKLSVNATPLPENNLQLNADYIVTDWLNLVGALPPPSTAVAAAFPDRFVRDPSGTLILVDNRSVNFARQHSRLLRLGAGFMVQVTPDQVIPGDRAAGTARRRVRGWRLQVNASHTFLLDSTTVIRPGLPEVDLLDGGAIGIGGGGQRHSSNASLALTRGGTGFRLEAESRGKSFLVIGTLAAPDRLTFDPITTVDAKAFAALGEVFPKVKLLRDTRLTVEVENIFNERQTVTNSANAIPQAYQPIYRDPIGRTFLVEIRKVF
jgi:hypothetical protein